MHIVILGFSCFFFFGFPVQGPWVQLPPQVWLAFCMASISIYWHNNSNNNNLTALPQYRTIIRRRRSEYWRIFPETKSRGIFTNIYEPEANNCFSIITQVIIEIPIKQRNVKFHYNFPLLIRVHTTLLASACHAMSF